MSTCKRSIGSRKMEQIPTRMEMMVTRKKFFMTLEELRKLRILIGSNPFAGSGF